MMEELLIAQKKEIKALDGSKRSAIKKAKAFKGKKGKDALAKVEEEYTAREKEMLQRHAEEIAKIKSRGEGGRKKGDADDNDDDNDNDDNDNDNAEASSTLVETTASLPVVIIANDAPPDAAKKGRSNNEEKQKEKEKGARGEENEDDGEAKRRRAREKARRKKEKAREKERERQYEIEKEMSNAGPSKRDVETCALMGLYLSPQNLTIREIEADGNCLYRAVADQVPDNVLKTFVDAREACADALLEYEEEFAPFAETDGGESAHGGSYQRYVDAVRHSNEWGGHLELRALSRKLRRMVVVYSADSSPLKIGEEFSAEDDKDDENLIRLSFHRHYYALGEHYNSVVPKLG